MPEKDKIENKEALLEETTIQDASEDTFLDDEIGPNFPTSINEDLKDLVDDNPNKLIGCGG